MKKSILFIRQIGVIVALLLFNLSFAQNSTVTGVVSDVNGAPIPGVNILIKDSSKSVVTDIDGKYNFSNLKNGTFDFIASYIGYKNVMFKIEVNGNVIKNITLTEDNNVLDDVIITGVVNPRTKIKSSVSITSINTKEIEQSAPRSTAEIFRTIPGIRSESSGGEGNSNISVRGVPISSGGSKYLQIQEDGLPVLLFGDIAFATADIFTRFDGNVARIEAIRGGSASTLSSNSPGGIINFISKTGKTEGGTMSTTFGLDYENFRTDIDYGAKIGDGLYFHVGGFYRTGEGVRKTGFNSNNGGQVKFNITKEFEKGSVTVYAKFLNDRAVAYMPMPVQVSGTNANPKWTSVDGYDATRGSMQSIYLNHNVGLGTDGNVRREKVANGMHPISKSIGASATFDLDNDWKVSDNLRYSANSGGFISPFPAELGTATAIANSFGAGSTLSYANDGTAFNTPNGLVARVHMFDTQLNDMSNFMNDLRLTKKIDNLGVTFGFFKSMQNVSMSWLWNSYLQEVSDNNPRLINVKDVNGNLLSENGLYAYGTPAWGNLARNYDTQYNVSAPYVNVSFDLSKNLSFEGGVRYDNGKVTGSFTGGTATSYDINNDGILSAPENNVFAVNTANDTPVNYTYDYFSYTLGGNYLLNAKQSLFARVSRGASAKADRILFNGLDYLDGDKINALDFLMQSEIGYKQKFNKGYVYATAFSSKTDEQAGYEAGANVIRQNNYKSLGLELESAYDLSDNLNLRGSMTYTKAEITSGADKGNEPRRQPKLMYGVMPTFKFMDKKNTLGLSFIGQTKAFAQDSNQLVMNGFVIVNGFVEVGLTKGLSVNLSGNNIFNSLAITEAEEGNITENTVNYVRARSLTGRSISMALSYRF
ncbi:TonB-dependent receptor [Flavobacterium sp. FPG59]|jgi:outer membrane receptor protein involved in Fe transport|uniref:TonB-dependent receptor domain-containing protein n=1 Tax=Flavobacterium sp. FPG59 TaxID=1929267 RepID=UPI000A3B651C|nr:TonB-dependent receptor [Flavobacterium sp. FPG59]OUD34694.1 TonB-dependent receptor [Flavobacterium sp. FPG59]